MRFDSPDSGERLARVLCNSSSPSPTGRPICLSPSHLRNGMLRWARSPTERTSAARLGGERDYAKSLGHVFAAISGTQRVPAAAAVSARIAAAAFPAGSAKMHVFWALQGTPPSSSLPLAQPVRHRDLSDQRSDTRFRSLHIASACSSSEDAACQATLKSLRRPNRARLALGYFQ